MVQRTWRPLLAGPCLLLMLTAGCRTPADGDGTPADGDGPPPPAAGGTSVLLITMDTTRADRLGCYGHPAAATPHIDALAAEGTLFRRAFAHTPLTIPSHSTIFTGQYPDRHGVRDNGDYFLSDQATTLAERFDAAGYDTAAAVSAYVTNHKWGFGQGFDVYLDHIASTGEMEASAWTAERRGAETVDDLLGWLEDRDDTPFFAWLHLFDPHHPYDPPPPFDERFPDKPYLGEIAYMDAQIGRVMEALRSAGLDDDTAVVLVGDHGESFGTHGEHHHGMFVYNATVHVPFVIRPPGGGAGGIVDEPVGLIDVAPTALALAGLPAPAEADAFDGIDLSPCLDGAAPPHRTLYGESQYVRYHYGWSEQRMAVDWPFKYIGSTRPQLFDIDADPGETDDLLARRTDVAARLRAFITRRESAASAPTAAGAIDDAMAAQLQALGYVAAVVDVDEGQALPDPKDRLDVLKDITRANAAMRAGELRKARELLTKVVRQEPSLVDPRLALAQVHARLGEQEEAQQQVGRALELAPRSTNAIGVAATVLVLAGDVDEALELLDRSLEIDDQNARTWGQRFKILFEERRYAELLQAADEAGGRLPGSPMVSGYRGAALVATGRLDDARPLLDQALASGAEPPWAHHAMGVIADADGDLEGSLTQFLAEAQAYPSHREAVMMVVRQAARLQRHDVVVEYATDALAADSAQPEMLHALGSAQLQLESVDEADHSARSCLELIPDDPDCMLLLANVQRRQGHAEEAEATFQRALELKRQQLPGAIVDGVRNFEETPGE